MIRLSLAAIVLPTALCVGQQFAVEPREASRAELCTEVFDPAQAMPWPADPSRSLAARLGQLAARRWPARAGPDGDCQRYARSFGDLVAAFLALRERPRAQELLARRLERERPEIWAEVGDVLLELVQDQRVLGDAWVPDDDRPDDGFLFGPTLELARDFPGWRTVDGSQSVFQAACLIEADLDAIETAENDYTAYFAHVGARYLSIYPLAGSNLRGTDADGPFAGLRVRFETDLPWPFSSYVCDLRIRKSLDADGHLVTETYSPSPDFLWIAGKNVYVPLFDADDRFVAMLAVRLFGLDIRGVPEADSNRRSGLRSVLGNLKRNAEQSYRARDANRPLVLAGAIPVVPVRGRR
ncbi:MAG: hypothetical protein IPM29_01265 [Planctomycetes bacterium]|nr:hypothetical protein [Planctomycetota bacterium]